MQQVLPGLPDSRIEQQTQLNTARDRRRLSLLKFYIHDSAAYFRLELIGELTETDLVELGGCWATAKSSVAGRKLALDVRRLKAVDEAGLQWLSSMVREGACYIVAKNRSGVYRVCPDWWPDCSDSDGNNCGSQIRRVFQRIFSFLRQSITEADTRSQTNTVNADSVRVTGL
ncbi:MAG TPA: hypothetical protein VG168_00105 [Bryobacteraceae bacterium]|jgi:ABC-type transporter Mla MlaB component|nr:hypothetical protein [Bryobacteraceae bacterium]